MAGHTKRQSFSINPAQSVESTFSIISGKHDIRGLKNVHEESFYILGRASSFQSEQESIKSGDAEVEEGPYGRFYEEITLKHLKEISYELGLITLTWPEIASPDYEQRKHFPQSYSVNSKKEKLLLLYAENFRRQYHYAYTFRKPLFLAADNECGLQKMVCTTIRPTTMHYAEFYTWQGCAQFICDHIIYEPLEKITLLPEQIRSPHTVLSKQKGNCFEMSILLCSYLVAAGYKAYVVSGYASLELCTNDRSRVACPLLEPDGEVELVTKEEATSKYVVQPPRDLQSKFLQEMKMREVRKVLEEEKRLAEEEQRDKEEYEAPQMDDYYGFRIHSWVVVLPGARDVTESFFIEPASGVRYDLSYQHYFGLESIWNNTNYWVNLQSTAEGCHGLQFKLADVKCWEHLLPGEPWQDRKAVRKVDPAELVLQEKHLDIPESWVSRLDVSNPTYEMRYPGGSKVTHYKKSILEQFAPYLQREGLVTRLTEYDDLDYMHPRLVHEHYLNCSDKLVRVTKNLKTEVVREEFQRGREDALKVHTCIQRDSTVEHERTLEFYSEARHDGLEKLLMHPLFMTEFFSGREDFLCYRHADFAPRGRGPVEPRRTVLKLLERFNRNPAKEANDDIAQQVFALADNEIHIKYHYEEGKVTAATREFVKPPAAELGERLVFNPALTCSYQTDATVPRPNQLSLFLLLEELLVTEDKSLYHVRDMEDEVGTILKTRASEMRFPRLLVSIFDKERNDSNKRSLKERGDMLRAKKIRETQSNVDYLAPYLARIGNPQLLQQRQALEVREVCLADYKQLLIDRANRMQKQFEAESAPLQEKHRWYEEVQDTLTREEEEEYFEYNNRVTFRLHALELRLNRHRELAAQRYLAVEACLRADPRLVILLW